MWLRHARAQAPGLPGVSHVRDNCVCNEHPGIKLSGEVYWLDYFIISAFMPAGEEQNPAQTVCTKRPSE